MRRVGKGGRGRRGKGRLRMWVCFVRFLFRSILFPFSFSFLSILGVRGQVCRLHVCGLLFIFIVFLTRTVAGWF